MAVNNEDRVSSQRLLDTLKGLQASRHLGSEPEVVTETVEYPAVVSPAAGTYQNAGEVWDAISTVAIDDKRLPLRVYRETAYNHMSGPYPITISDRVGDYVEVSKKDVFGADSNTAYYENNYEDFNSYTGFVVWDSGDEGYIANYVENGEVSTGIIYQWEMPAYTETTTTKTKHPIKQDYVPNADWNVNDPDGDGYVENRTHWVEEDIADVEVEMAMGLPALPSFMKPMGYAWSDGSWYPEFEAIDLPYSGVYPGWYLAEDENGEQLFTFDDLTEQPTNYCYVVDVSSQMPNTYVVFSPNPQTVISVRGEAEVVHKLPTKYINKNDLGIPKIEITSDGATVNGDNINTYPKAYRINYRNPNNTFIDDLIIIPITGYQRGLWYCKLRVHVGTYNENNGVYSNTSETHVYNTPNDLYELIKRQLGYTEDKTFNIEAYRSGIVSFGDADNPSGDHGAYIGNITISIEMNKNTTETTVEHKVITNSQVSSGNVRPEFYMEGLFTLTVGTV